MNYQYAQPARLSSHVSATYVISLAQTSESKHAPNSEIIKGIPSALASASLVFILSLWKSRHSFDLSTAGSPVAQTSPPSWQQYEWSFSTWLAEFFYPPGGTEKPVLFTIPRPESGYWAVSKYMIEFGFAA